ncbi:fumarylacetoacetate hydrolase family protein [Emcibacter sp.]|uniref:fumarylacetoacetate hydrolase family protein n=1 Tax=Emcibacter sp. TaxID=1979954 RepID=UPI003A8FC88C
MSDYLFTPPPVASLPVRGSDKRYPLRRIFCVGQNYSAHAREMGFTADKENPFFFTKSAQAFAASGSEVAYAPGTENLHYEMEMVIMLGSEAFQVTSEQALEAVYGYACGLDMTRRDLQKQCRDKGRPWSLGKDFENAAVISEVIPVSDCGHLSEGQIELRLNGEIKQSGDLSDMLNGPAELISFLSRYYHLGPGDAIFAGTPEGVGPVLPGDRLEGKIEGLGTISLAIGDKA